MLKCRGYRAQKLVSILLLQQILGHKSAEVLDTGGATCLFSLAD